MEYTDTLINVIAFTIVFDFPVFYWIPSIQKKVHVGNDQEKVQSEKDSHSKNYTADLRL